MSQRIPVVIIDWDTPRGKVTYPNRISLDTIINTISTHFQDIEEVRISMKKSDKFCPFRVWDERIFRCKLQPLKCPEKYAEAHSYKGCEMYQEETKE